MPHLEGCFENENVNRPIMNVVLWMPEPLLLTLAVGMPTGGDPQTML